MSISEKVDVLYAHLPRTSVLTDVIREDINSVMKEALCLKSTLEQFRTLEYAKVYCKDKADSLADDSMHSSAVGVSEAMNVLDIMINIRLGILDEQLNAISNLCGNIREDLKRYNQG